MSQCTSQDAVGFCDGNTSTEVNPVHTYEIPSEGAYKFSVSLTAYGPGDPDTEVKVDVIVRHVVW
jgi:PKD repeat protein